MPILLILFAPVIVWFSTVNCPEIPQELVDRQTQAETVSEKVIVQVESMCAVRKIQKIFKF